ncbi:RsmB/NOP family class I SAM-dependent RNA methyltransferase [Pseudohoeflea sp. DP4N28-3]|uniref:RsmB/NOP family class I SAM-dependent RNA methyltransferase n=1 Tax=Pseudohoeflea coraliihabitans TaxID=2860393 RepID=A0ABS6WT69_9HYPH|nr:RsmB/NOP family class I SAM-dependent RNA methyltransferase [Pseudohoeflea sp. DP4N28-3]
MSADRSGSHSRSKGSPGSRRKPASAAQGRREAVTKPGLEARIAATRLLGAVIDGRASLDGLLDRKGGNPHFLALSEPDRQLVRAILAAALRHLTVLEALIDRLTDKPLPEGARSLRHLLVVALTQILHLDVADHAAVDLAVSQAQIDPRNKRFASLVNAVLRRLIRERETLLSDLDAVSPFPDWYMGRLAASHAPATVDAIARALKVPAPLDLSVKSDAAGWAERLGGTVIATGSVRLPPGGPPVPELAGFETGEWWVQDAAASLPARLFSDLSGKRVADLCAAPGGKTAQLILQGGVVTAFDQSASRLQRLEDNLARLGLSAHVVRARAQEVVDEEGFDAVLLDAPCSSTGTVRRHPDVVWTKSFTDVETLARVQRQLLDHAARLVRPGGELVFSNCSLDPLEGEELVAGFLADHPAWRIKPILPANWPGLEETITGKGEMRTHPAQLAHEDERLAGLDGFYAVVLTHS